MFFFFKQKTAYEMRISDWSSDVCSSDLLVRARQRQLRQRLGRCGNRTFLFLATRITHRRETDACTLLWAIHPATRRRHRHPCGTVAAERTGRMADHRTGPSRSLHPSHAGGRTVAETALAGMGGVSPTQAVHSRGRARSEEQTSELKS